MTKEVWVVTTSGDYGFTIQGVFSTESLALDYCVKLRRDLESLGEDQYILEPNVFAYGPFKIDKEELFCIL